MNLQGVPGHLSFSKVFPLSTLEGQLSIKGYTWSPNLWRWMTTLVLELAPHPLLQHKLRLLIHALQRTTHPDKAVSLVSTGYSVFQLDTNISLVFKK